MQDRRPVNRRGSVSRSGPSAADTVTSRPRVGSAGRDLQMVRRRSRSARRRRALCSHQLAARNELAMRAPALSPVQASLARRPRGPSRRGRPRFPRPDTVGRAPASDRARAPSNHVWLEQDEGRRSNGPLAAGRPMRLRLHRSQCWRTNEDRGICTHRDGPLVQTSRHFVESRLCRHVTLGPSRRRTPRPR